MLEPSLKNRIYCSALVAFVEKCQHSPETSSRFYDVHFVSCVTRVRSVLLSSSIMDSIWGFASYAPPQALS